MIRFHWQNLNEDSRGRPKGCPWHGRAWLTIGALKLRWSWNLWTYFCHAYLQRIPQEGEMVISVAFPPFAFWFGVESNRFWRKSEREIGFHIHDWSIWWRLWSPFDSWSSKTPKWRDGSWRPGRTFFGKWIYDTRLIEQRAVRIPMPEGEYPATAELRYAVRGHRFSPFKHRQYEVEIRLSKAIPYSGKGENSWDCGEDGLYGRSGPARTIEEAIGQTVTSVLETRRRRGDPAKWPVAPEARHV